MTQVTINGNTYADDGTNRDLPTGWRTWFLVLLSDLVQHLASYLGSLGGAMTATSSTNTVAIGTGNLTLTVQPSKAFAAGMWVAATDSGNAANWVVGQVTAYNASTGVLTVTVASGDTSGSGTPAGWTVVVSGKRGLTGATGSVGARNRAAKTATFAVGVPDQGKVFDVTSGTFSITFDAAATLGDGFFTTIRNSGAGVVTLDPNGGELIDGSSTMTLSAGQSVDVLCDGSALKSLAKNGGGSGAGIIDGGTVGGTANAITLAPATPVATLSAGMAFFFTPPGNNTGAVTIVVSGGGAIDLKRIDGSALPSGTLVSTQKALVIFDGAVFRLPADYAGGKGADIASAATIALPPVDDYFHITGTTGISAISARRAGAQITLRFAGALTLTHNGTSLILPGATNIVTAANDAAVFRSEGGGNWRCVDYTRASGQAVVSYTPSASSNGYGTRTVSTGAPSGGADGDLWYRV